MKWLIGNGDMIKVWEENWLYRGPSLPATRSGVISHPNIKVKDLFIPGSREWNVPLIPALVHQDDANYIFYISQVKQQERISWSGATQKRESTMWSQDTIKKQASRYLNRSAGRRFLNIGSSQKFLLKNMVPGSSSQN